MELLLVLGVPFAGSILLGFWGHRNFAPELNSGMSLLTFVAAAALTARIIADGPILVWDEMFFVDSFNVFLVALTAFVAFTTSLFSRPYMRIELHHGKLTPNRLRLY
ncbi:MAG: hydrogenase 4 subunit F, partial [Burkholderiales bacterium]